MDVKLVRVVNQVGLRSLPEPSLHQAGNLTFRSLPLVEAGRFEVGLYG